MQIGPKIRIGGTVGKIGQKVKEGVGQVAKTVAPIASFINPAVGAGLAAAGTALDTSKGGVGLGSILKSGAGNFALGKVAGGLPGASSIGGALKSIPGVSALGSAVGSLPGATALSSLLGSGGGAAGESGGLGGLLNAATGFLTGNGGANALGLAQAANAVNLGKQSTGYAKDALAGAERAYNDKAPLRAAGMQGLLNPDGGNLDELTSIRHSLGPSAPNPTPLPQTMDASALRSVQDMLHMPEGNFAMGAQTADPRMLDGIRAGLPSATGSAPPLPPTGDPTQLRSVRSLLAMPNANLAGSTSLADPSALTALRRQAPVSPTALLRRAQANQTPFTPYSAFAGA